MSKPIYGATVGTPLNPQKIAEITIEQATENSELATKEFVKESVDSIHIPSKVSELENDSKYLTTIPDKYVTEEELTSKDYATKSEVDTKVDKVKGKSLISDTEIERLSHINNYDDTEIKETLKNKANLTDIPTKVSELDNDEGYLTSYTETDPTVPSWAKEETKPIYTKSEVGLSNVDNVRQYSETNPPPYPVVSINNKTGKVSLSASDVKALPDNTHIPSTLAEMSDDTTHRVVTDSEKSTWNSKANISDIPTDVSQLNNDIGYLTSVPVTKVNNKVGDVTLSASDVKARPDDWLPNYSDVGADKSGTAESTVNSHNVNDGAHNDIRLLIEGLTTRLNTIANSTDKDLDQMAEIVAYIKANKELIDSVTTSKVNVDDIIDNLTTSVSNKPLSAKQGVVLKGLIDAITIPTKVSELENDEGYLKAFTESDPTVPSWAKQDTKPSYTKSEVGLGNVDNVKQYSESNPPPYPVTSVNGKTGAVSLKASDVEAVAKGELDTLVSPMLSTKMDKFGEVSTSTNSGGTTDYYITIPFKLTVNGSQVKLPHLTVDDLSITGDTIKLPKLTVDELVIGGDYGGLLSAEGDVIRLTDNMMVYGDLTTTGEMSVWDGSNQSIQLTPSKGLVLNLDGVKKKIVGVATPDGKDDTAAVNVIYVDNAINDVDNVLRDILAAIKSGSSAIMTVEAIEQLITSYLETKTIKEIEG
jgi:hypothetical protein